MGWGGDGVWCGGDRDGVGIEMGCGVVGIEMGWDGDGVWCGGDRDGVGWRWGVVWWG